jgi:pimeloyl-ACP methyl ester carboxylesterase
MIHGIGAPLELWRPLETKLHRFRTVTVDPPGAGRSSMPKGRFRIADYAGVMEDLLTHLRLESANVLGLSLGGMMAQELAHRSPGRVEKLVLASTAPGWTLNPKMMSAFASPARRHTGWRDTRNTGDPQQPLDPRASQDADESSLAALLALHWHARRTYSLSPRGYLVGLRAAWGWTSRPWLAELSMPVLAISGSSDPIVPAANSRLIASRVPDGRLEIFPGGGHLCVLRESGKAARLIGDFLHDA